MTGRHITITGHNQVWDLREGPSVYAATDQGLFGSGPVRVGEQAQVGIPGTRVTGLRHSARDFEIPIHLLGDSPANLDEIIEDIASDLDAVRGPVTVQVESDRYAGTTRSISAFLLGGLESLLLEQSETAQASPVLAFRATYPYWRDDTPRTQTIPSGFGVDVTNTGGAEAWPTWTVTGPCPAITIADDNDSTKTWTWPAGLTSGQTLKVITRPGEGRVLRNNVRIGGLADGSRLFGFAPKATTVIRATGAPVNVSFYEEFLTC